MAMDRQRQWLAAAREIRPHLPELVDAPTAEAIATALDDLLEAARKGTPVADAIKRILLANEATKAWTTEFFAELARRDAAKERAHVDDVPAKALRVENEVCTVVPVFYGTDRQPTGKADPARFFGGRRGQLSFGIVEVSVPHDREVGALPSPHWWRLELKPNPRRHVFLVKLERLERQDFVARLAGSIAAVPRRDALLFVHGYNVSFEDAARRTAQIAVDLNFEGIPVLYSWPSEGATLRYKVDENNVGWTVPRFRQFLELVLAETGASVVHVIAHSMGNRCLVEALRTFDRAALPPGSAELSQVIFAAPDIDAGTFVDLAAEFRAQASRFTLYASSRDKALLGSKLFNGYPRAGDSGPGLVIVDGVDTVDASTVDTDLLGHSYLGDSDSVLADVFDLIRDGRAPAERFHLRARERAGRRYWQFTRKQKRGRVG